MKIWKLSLGKEEFDNDVFKNMIINQVVSVHPTTKAKGQSSKSQWEYFKEANKGDLFYLCRSNDSIELIGMFKDVLPLVAMDDGYAKNGWIDREFITILPANNSKGYNKNWVNSKGKKPWWHSGDNSTFIEVPKSNFNLFEEEILKPVFDNWSINDLKNKRKIMLNSLSINAYKLQMLQKEFQSIYGKNNQDVLMSLINKIERIDIKKLLFYYNNIENIEKSPVVLLRKEIIEYISTKPSIDEKIINDIKDELDKRYEKDVYIRWSLFSILYPLYYFKYKGDVVTYLDKLVLLIRKKLKIVEFTSFTKPFHFDGANNFGKDTIWFAIFNNTYKSQRHAYQLLFAIQNGKFEYGLWHEDKKNECKIVKDVTLSFYNLIKIYKQYIDKIKFDDSKEQAMLTGKTDLLEFQKQIILQGPPGTGKTRLAKQMARFIIMGETTPNIGDIQEQVKLIQFHPSYSYEDFVRGIVAHSDSNGNISYKTENKVLAEMAEKSLNNSDKKYILIIDEINRANLSSVLGELIYSLEYRGEAVDSMYALDNGSREIILPSNLYIIGTMNTADRSIGHIDYAIRRRFTFIDVLSNENNILDSFPHGKQVYNNVIKLFTTEFISPEFNIDDIKIGHSYFITENDDIEELKNKLEFQVKPLLREYVKDGVLNENSKKIVEELKVEANN